VIQISFWRHFLTYFGAKPFTSLGLSPSRHGAKQAIHGAIFSLFWLFLRLFAVGLQNFFGPYFSNLMRF
jgi:hypothetical protein